MKRMLICMAVVLPQPVSAQEETKREFTYAKVVGHVEAAAKLCKAPANAYRPQVTQARADLPRVFRRARLAPEAIDGLIETGRLEVAGWMPALDCAEEFVKVVRNLSNWIAAAKGWPPPAN